MVVPEEKLGELPVEQAEVLAQQFTCKGCGESFDTVQKLATHSRYCPDAKALREAEQQPAEVEQDQEEEAVSPYRDGEGEPNEILRHILTSFPGVTDAVVKEVMSWAELWGYIPPYYLPYLLGQMKGVSQGTANLITQKYSLSTQKNQQALGQQPPGMSFTPPMGMGQGMGQGMGVQPQMFPPAAPMPGMGTAYGYPRAYGYQRQPPPGGITKRDLEALEERLSKKSEMQILKESVTELTRSMGTIKNDIIREVGDSRTRYREIRVPIDAQGNPTDPRTATSVRYEKVPMGGGGQPGISSDIIRRLDQMDKKITDTALSDIRKDLEEIKKGGLGSGPQSREMQKLETQLEKNEEMIGELSGQIESNKYQALLDELGRIKTQMGRASGGEWNSDEMKFVATALDKLTDVIREKSPMETLRDMVVPPTLETLPPDMKGVVEGTPVPLVERLRSEGLVTVLRRGGR